MAGNPIKRARRLAEQSSQGTSPARAPVPLRMPNGRFYQGKGTSIWSVPVIQNDLRALALEFVEWAEKNEVYNKDLFPAQKHISPRKFFDCIDEYVQDAIDIGCSFIADRLIKAALSRSIDSLTARWLIPYHSKGRQNFDEHMKGIENDNNTRIRVIVEQIPSSNAVPEYKQTEHESCP